MSKARKRKFIAYTAEEYIERLHFESRVEAVAEICGAETPQDLLAFLEQAAAWTR